MPIRFLDMFAGIGGFRSGLERLGGFECVLRLNAALALLAGHVYLNEHVHNLAYFGALPVYLLCKFDRVHRMYH